MAKAMAFEILSFPINIAKVSHNMFVTGRLLRLVVLGDFFFFQIKLHVYTRCAPEEESCRFIIISHFAYDSWVRKNYECDILVRSPALLNLSFEG